MTSVTRFGEILPLWPKFTSIWQIVDSLFLIWHNTEHTLANLWHYLATFHCCKWPKIKNNLTIWPHWLWLQSPDYDYLDCNNPLDSTHMNSDHCDYSFRLSTLIRSKSLQQQHQGQNSLLLCHNNKLADKDRVLEFSWNWFFVLFCVFFVGVNIEMITEENASFMAHKKWSKN